MCECCTNGHFHTAIFNVSGMSCNHCVNAIKDEVEKLKGIKNIEINLEGGLVKVEYNPNDLREEHIRNAIIDAGYEVK